MGRPVFSTRTEDYSNAASRAGELETAAYGTTTVAAGTESGEGLAVEGSFSGWEGETLYLSDVSFAFKNGNTPGAAHDVACVYTVQDSAGNDIWSTRLNGSQTALTMDPAIRFRSGSDTLAFRIINNSGVSVDVSKAVSFRRSQE